MWAYPWLRAEKKKSKGSGNSLHISSYRGLNIIHTETWMHTWLKNAQNVPFCFCRVLITSCLHRKDTKLSLQYILAFWESLGTRLLLTQRWLNGKLFSLLLRPMRNQWQSWLHMRSHHIASFLCDFIRYMPEYFYSFSQERYERATRVRLCNSNRRA